MKIIPKNNRTLVEFDTLLEGDLFRDSNSNDIYMKLEYTIYMANRAVNLTNGKIFKIYNSHVYPVDAELIEK